eukprot:m.23637 g.23637  ORF g.23637 m.23637 type:complete len:419 (+) comp4091_c0_seq1:435-1691(+)
MEELGENPVRPMFWALQIKPSEDVGCRVEYSRTLESDSRISTAALGGVFADSATKDHGCVRVMMKVDEVETVLCTLRDGEVPQAYLDIRLPAETLVSFWCTGGNIVHLTGYREAAAMDLPDHLLMDNPDLFVSTSDGDESDEDDAEEDGDDSEEEDESEDDDSDDDLDDEEYDSEELDDMMHALAGDYDSEEDSDMDDDEWVAVGGRMARRAPPGMIEEVLDDDEEDGKEKGSNVASATPARKREHGQDDDAKPTSAKKSKTATDALKDLYAKTKAAETEAAKQKKAPDTKPKEAAAKDAKPKGVQLAKGVVVFDTKVGTGKVATRGSKVTMHYTGRLKKNNRVFDSSRKGRSQPFKFKLGAREVIDGWEIGIEGMKVGGKRTLHIPSKAGYGADGAGSDIPPHADLVFDVECLGVKK